MIPVKQNTTFQIELCRFVAFARPRSASEVRGHTGGTALLMQLSHPMDPSGAWHRMAIHSNNCQTGDADDACETIDLPVLSVCSV